MKLPKHIKHLMIVKKKSIRLDNGFTTVYIGGDTLPILSQKVTIVVFMKCDRFPIITSNIKIVIFIRCSKFPIIPNTVTVVECINCVGSPNIPPSVTVVGGVKPHLIPRHATTYIYYVKQHTPTFPRYIERVTLVGFEDTIGYSKKTLLRTPNLGLENCVAMYELIREEAAAAFVQPWLCMWKGI